MRWIGQQEGEGGLVDMFVADIKETDRQLDKGKKKRIPKKLSKQTRYCPACGYGPLKRMGPR